MLKEPSFLIVTSTIPTGFPFYCINEVKHENMYIRFWQREAFVLKNVV